MTGQPPAPQILLQRQYSYRKLQVLGVGTFLLGFFLAIAAFAVRTVQWEGVRDPWGFAAALVMIAPFGFLGLLLLRWYFTNKIVLLVITPEGIRFGSSEWPWRRIKCLVPRYAGARGYDLVMHLHGFLSPDRWLAFDEPLSWDEYLAFREKALQAIRPHSGSRP